MTTDKRTHMSGKDIIDLNKFLETVMHPVSGTEFFKYNEGWNDDRLVKEFKGGKFSLAQLKRNRASLGYKMPRAESIFKIIIDRHNQLVDTILMEPHSEHIREKLEESRITKLNYDFTGNRDEGE